MRRQDFPPHQYRQARGYRNSTPDDQRYGRRDVPHAPSFEGGRQRGSEHYESAQRWRERQPGWRAGRGHGEDFARRENQSRDYAVFGEPYDEAGRGGDYASDWRGYGREAAGRGGEYPGAFESEFGREYRGGQDYGYGAGRRERKGPKGYARSDERIRDDVCERLYGREDIEVSDVSVEVKNGKVALEGTVPERHMKHSIEDVVDDCIGVQDIDNRIRVQRASEESATERRAPASARRH